MAALGGAAPAPSWSVAAVQDLQAMHDLIRDNHPGAADAQDAALHRWLDNGEAYLMAEARRARSLHDYQLVLRRYANGFADGHLGVTMKDAEPELWPGFLVRADAPAGTVVVSMLAGGTEAPAGVHPGDAVQSCDGQPVRALLDEKVLRPRLNPHVPQRLPLASAWLMVADEDAPQDQWQSCVLSDRGKSHRVALRWRPIDQAALDAAQARSAGIEIPPVALRRIGDVWLLSIPSFYAKDAAAAAKLTELVAAVKAHAAELHAARHVVLDVRGNTGGDDDWGYAIAAALWGEGEVDAVAASMPTLIDWRVSARNLATLRDEAATSQARGDRPGAAYLNGLAGRMAVALQQHQVFLRETGDAVRPAGHLVSPFQHPVDVLTTPHCASACLDFLDLLDGLPGVVRIGMETSTDTGYLEVATAGLPSGQATLRYPMKVYRQRKRGANVSYAPAIPWGGGDMDDASIVRWVDEHG